MTRSRASAKKAGSSFERLIADYLAAVIDDRIDRKVRTGARDTGDIAGIRLAGHRVVIEAKNCARQDLPAWTREAHTEADNDAAIVGVVVAKRHGVTDPARQWVHMELGDLVAILKVVGQ